VRGSLASPDSLIQCVPEAATMNPPQCNFFFKGICHKGQNCPCAHTIPQPQNEFETKKKMMSASVAPFVLPSVKQIEQKKTNTHKPKKLSCIYHQQGFCVRGGACKFSHDNVQIPLCKGQSLNCDQTVKKNELVITPEKPKRAELTSPSKLTELLNSTPTKQNAADRGVKVDLDFFEILSVVGDGLVGKIFQVVMKGTNKVYAMKVMRKKRIVDQVLINGTQTERNIMLSIEHPFITKLHYAFQTDKKLYLIMDYLPGGDLSYHLNNMGRFNEKLTQFYAAEIGLALNNLHGRNIIYRDLKASNTLLDLEGHIRLADFGMAKQMSTEIPAYSFSFCGTTRYMAPEIIKETGYGSAVDWWAYGVLLFQMLTGRFPYDDDDEDNIADKILNDRLDFPSNISQHSKALIRGLLHRNPSQRFGWAEVRRQPFFKSIDWNKLETRQIQPPWKPPAEEGELDTGNFPSSMTGRTPVDSVVETEPLFAFQEFTYTSPTNAGDIMKISGEIPKLRKFEWNLDESNAFGDFRGELVPDDACFSISL